MQYQRIPESMVDAFIWTGGPDQTEDPEWAVKAIEDGKIWFVEKDNECMMAVLTPYGQVLAKSGDYVFLDKDGINVAPKDYFEKTFIPTLDEQKRKILEACYLQTLELLREAFR